MNVFDLALWIDDPAGLDAVTLARTVLSLVHDRDTATMLALTSELRALAFKYPRPSPIAVESSAGAEGHPDPR
jgi:hypothetical protein